MRGHVSKKQRTTTYAGDKVITFRNSKIVYYGPHECPNCGVLIVKMGVEFGGTAFTNPEGPIYPNTEWHPHVCDPDFVRSKIARSAEACVKTDFPNANSVKIDQLGYVVLGELIDPNQQAGSCLCVSAHQTFYDTADAAWAGAFERSDKGWPSWHIDLNEYGLSSKFGDDLERLPQCSR
jgi:hypothetical protein